MAVDETRAAGAARRPRDMYVQLVPWRYVSDRRRDMLTHYTRPLTGAYYFVPAADSLRRFIPDD